MGILSKDEFFEKYASIKDKKDKFESLGYSWDEMQHIYNDYIEKSATLEAAADSVVNVVSTFDRVHSIRRRIKDPEHLIEKIIRRSIEKNEKFININNYIQEITDLIGIRILHLYKEDWVTIHDSIMNSWDSVEEPTANIRRGDQVDLYVNNKCVIKEHHFGYRSVHYLIYCDTVEHLNAVIEIQVRTLFEEAWSEIDHQVRYPYNVNDPILGGYLTVFSGLIGNIDNMGSYLKFLKDDLDKKQGQKFREMGYMEKEESVIPPGYDDILEPEEVQQDTVSQEKDIQSDLEDIYSKLDQYGYNNSYIQNYAIDKLNSMPVENLHCINSGLQRKLGAKIVEIAPSNSGTGSHSARDFLRNLPDHIGEYPLHFILGIFLSTLKRHHYLWISEEYFGIVFEALMQLREQSVIFILEKTVEDLDANITRDWNGYRKGYAVKEIIEKHIGDFKALEVKNKLIEIISIIYRNMD